MERFDEMLVEINQTMLHYFRKKNQNKHSLVLEIKIQEQELI